MSTIKHEERRPVRKLIGKWPSVLAVAIALAVGVVSIYSLAKSRSTSQNLTSNPSKNEPVLIGVGALGQIEPQGEVIHLSAPYALQGARVGQLLVNKGDKVRVGQVVAILDTHASRLASLKQAETQVKIAQASLAQVKAGAKAGDITAQEAAIANLEAELSGQIAAQEATSARLRHELHNAQAEHRRYQQLYKGGAISASQADNRRLRVETILEQLDEAQATLSRTIATNRKQQTEAKARLESIAEVRPTDVQAAQADIDNAKATVQQAQAELELTYMRSPIDGQVLKIYTWPGEIVSNQGIVELGQTSQMYVVAEVYETDIQKVRIGQPATITLSLIHI